MNNIIEHYNQSDFYRQNFVHDLSRFCKANPECAYLAFDLLMKCLQRESNAQYFGKYQIAYNALADAMIASEFPDEQISKFLEYTIRQYSGSAVAKPTGNYMKLLRKYRNKTTEIAENMIEIANAGHSQFGDSSSKYKIQRLIDGLDANDDKQ